MTELTWYYAKDGAQHGPVTAPDLRKMAAAGELLPDDLIWREGMADWTPARNLKRLFSPGGSSPSNSGSSHVLSGDAGSTPSSMMRARSALAMHRKLQNRFRMRLAVWGITIGVILIFVALLLVHWNGTSDHAAQTAGAALYLALIVSTFSISAAIDRFMRILSEGP